MFNTEISKKFWKKVLFLFLIIISLVILVIFSVRKSFDSLSSYINITFPQGYNDRGFNQKIIEGVCEGEGIKTYNCNGKNNEFSSKIGFAFSGSALDPEINKKHIDYFIKTYGVDKIVLPGFTMTSFLQKYLKSYDEKIKFVSVGTYYSKDKNDINWPKNLWQTNSLQHYSGYHAGIYSAAWAAENLDKLKDGNKKRPGKQIHFSSIGGLTIDPILKYALGFKVGIYVFNKIYQLNNPNTDINKRVEFIHSEYDEIGSFDASDLTIKKKAKTVSERIFANGSSIIFMIAVPFVSDAADAALEQDEKSNKKHFVIGVDVDAKENLGGQQLKKIITSAIIDYKRIVTNIYKTEIYKKLSGKNLIFGGHNFGTIPESYKKDSIWKKYFVQSTKYKDVINLNSLGSVLSNKPEIAKIDTKTDISKIALNNKGLILLYLEYLKSINKIADKKEYQDLLRSENPIEYMRKRDLSLNDK